MKYIVLALVACLFAGHADAQTLDAASQGAEIQKMFREKKLKHCSRVFMDGGVWEVISANNDSARIMNGVLTRILDLNDIEELSKIMPLTNGMLQQTISICPA